MICHGGHDWVKTNSLSLRSVGTALLWKEHLEYEAVQSTNPALNNAVVRINIFKTHRQTIQYIAPQHTDVLAQAELLVIDEAAAIPLPLVKSLMGPYAHHTLKRHLRPKNCRSQCPIADGYRG